MNILRRLAARFRRSRLEDQLAEEIQLHVELRRQDLIDRGMDPRNAEVAARRLFGNVTTIREETRDMWGFPSVDTLMQDLRYGLRVMNKGRGFSAVAIVSLAIGIGAASVLFSFANAFLFRPLPDGSSAELMQVFTSDEDGPLFGGSSYADYEDLRDRSAVFGGLLAFRGAKATLSFGEQRIVVRGALVSANYFEVLGLRASQGRFFLPEENSKPGQHPVVVLSHDGWRRQFASDPQVIGRAVGLNGHAFTVIGVGPPRFAGVSFDHGADFFVPTMMERVISPGDETLTERRARVYRVLGLLKPGVSKREADAALRLLAAQLFLQNPKAWQNKAGRGRLLTVLPEIEARFAGAGPGTTLWLFWSVMAGVVVLLGIACVNVATVLLARAAERRKEIAVRLALGASRRRVVRQLLTEGALLAAGGGVLGLLLAQWAAALFAQWRPDEVPPFDPSLDSRILVFTIAASVLTILFFGLAPALQTTRPDVNAELKDHPSPLRIRRVRIGLRDALVIVQVALSLVLIVGALLMLRSAWTGRLADPGFRREGVLTVEIDLSTTAASREGRARFYRAAVESVGGLPGVERTALAALVPLDGSNRRTAIEVRGRGEPIQGTVDLNVVGAGYFELLGIRVVQGREFLTSDREGAPTVAVVNETMARQVWQGDAVGRTFTDQRSGTEFQVVGIVRDVRHRSFSEPPISMAFFAADQNDSSRMSLHSRTSGPPRALGDAIQRALREIDPAAGVGRVRTMTEYIEDVTMPQRIGGAVAAVVGGLELSLAVMALYGVIAYTTARRTREIGVRLALGAPSGSVTRLIMRDGLVLGGAGIALGTVLALIAAPIVGSLLIGVGPADPVSFVVAALVLLMVAACASYVPARRALRIDPSVALRAE